MKFRNLILAAAFFLACAGVAVAQDGAPDNWFNLDRQQDGVQGVSTEKTYETLLKGRKSQTVIVAIIDSGVDPEHEDLKDIMWVNPGEIPGNGIDDDGNGYVDDVYGWNFIGGANGENIAEDTYEAARLYAFYRDKFKGRDAGSLKGKEKKEYERYMEIKTAVDEERENLQSNLDLYTGIQSSIQSLQQAIGKEDITAEDLQDFETEDPDMQRAIAILGNVMMQGGTVEDIMGQLDGAIKYFSNGLNYGQNPDFDPRPIVGDNYADSYERYYGNNDVKGPDASHGTHVAGIVAAVRGNGIGMDGVADNVRIMSVRAVPDGDERDKDVANAIIYAVDNGASIINMSFGKGYSWDKEAVDKAVKYAEKRDVLLVHAAGNSAQNNDVEVNVPNKYFEKKGLFGKKEARNWIEVGALSWKTGEDAPATFSNYGKKTVDVFAPGVDIYSTTPDQGYASFSGTSMASPVTAGVAAVLRSYFPELTARQVREIILASVVVQDQQVKMPGAKRKVSFNELCATGGVVNLHKAVELASITKGKKK